MGNYIAVLLEAVVKYTNTQSMKKRHFSRIKNGRENERYGIYEKISVSSGSIVCHKKWICYSGNLKIPTTMLQGPTKIFLGERPRKM